MDLVSILKEFTRAYMAGFVTWIGTIIVTLMFAGIEIPFLVHFKKNPVINIIPIILTAIVGGGAAWAAGLHIFFVILGVLTGGGIGYWADRYAAQNIGKNVSWLTNKRFKNMLFKNTSSSVNSSVTTKSSYSGPSHTNSSDFGGGKSSGGGGTSKW